MGPILYATVSKAVFIWVCVSFPGPYGRRGRGWGRGGIKKMNERRKTHAIPTFCTICSAKNRLTQYRSGAHARRAKRIALASSL